MSGNKIIPILDVHKDTFVHGGGVKKLKYVDRVHSTELVLCTQCTFKIHQHKAKPPAKVELKEGESPPPPPPPPKPLLQWRQQHSYVHSVIPLSGKPGWSEPFGFAVLFFSFKAPKKELSPLMQQLASNCESAPLGELMPKLRTREFVCSSQYDQDDWCTMYNIVLINYWHQRLEAVYMPEPEIFQYQTFALDKNGLAVRQLALSTTKLYVIPRHDQKSIEHDDNKACKSFVVSTLKKCVVGEKSTVLMQFGTGDVSISFFSLQAGSTFILELQRIFELCHGSDMPFPHEAK